MKRIPSLDGLRAISISLVLVGHTAYEGHAPAFLTPYGPVGVRIFFVISGYLITTILEREHERTSSISLRNFYIRRAYRIFPAALFFMGIVFAVYWRSLRWFEISAAFLYLANYLPFRPWVLAHLWSLSVEEQFYLLWPGVLKKWYQRRVPILLCVMAFSPVYTAGLYYLKWYDMVGGDTLPTVADGLALGCLISVFRRRWPKIPKSVAALLVAAMIAIPLYKVTSAAGTLCVLFLLKPILTAAIGGILIHVVQNPYWILNFAPVVWLGQISYSLYLWQQPFTHAADNPVPAWRYGIFGAFAMACVSYYLIERPVLRYRDSRQCVPTPAPVEKATAA
jgi:peptidoglycan/LPS O-acetylase OafA/YrhL